MANISMPPGDLVVSANSDSLCLDRMYEIAVISKGRSNQRQSIDFAHSLGVGADPFMAPSMSAGGSSASRMCLRARRTIKRFFPTRAREICRMVLIRS